MKLNSSPFLLIQCFWLSNHWLNKTVYICQMKKYGFVFHLDCLQCMYSGSEAPALQLYLNMSI
uniref:Uncharacterized protein n=1 Tax=Anguilla anguilla TaxID=7936 RepID=A0A0E9WYV5_ANGAN